jgi:hypothetical protein
MKIFKEGPTEAELGSIPRPKAKEAKKSSFIEKVWMLASLIFFVWLGVTHLNQYLDRSGWLTHTKDTTVFIQGNWWVGEHRHCFMNVGGSTDDTTLGCSAVSGSSGNFSWSSFPVHVLPVEYQGRVDRHEELIEWDCQRKEASLICKAIN